jgi:hypothetical protein
MSDDGPTPIHTVEDEGAAQEQHQHPLAEHPAYKALARLMDQNHARRQALAKEGVQLNEDSILVQRLELLIEFMLPSDSTERLEYESIFHKQIEEALDGAERQLRQSKLTGKRAGAPKLFVPGRG